MKLENVFDNRIASMIANLDERGRANAKTEINGNLVKVATEYGKQYDRMVPQK